MKLFEFDDRISLGRREYRLLSAPSVEATTEINSDLPPTVTSLTDRSFMRCESVRDAGRLVLARQIGWRWPETKWSRALLRTILLGTKAALSFAVTGASV